MEIRNQGQGVHAREIHGLGQLRHLPKEWYAYTNLEVSRVLLVDLKDWKNASLAARGLGTTATSTWARR
jgi:hypothetical protein